MYVTQFMSDTLDLFILFEYSFLFHPLRIGRREQGSRFPVLSLLVVGFLPAFFSLAESLLSHWLSHLSFLIG
jgi:hypothetical protein